MIYMAIKTDRTRIRELQTEMNVWKRRVVLADTEIEKLEERVTELQGEIEDVRGSNDKLTAKLLETFGDYLKGKI